MLTKNFYNAFYCCMAQKSKSGGLTATDGTIQNAYYNSSNFNYMCADFFDTFIGLKSVSTSKTKTGVVFGTGNTAPALNDYWLSGSLLTTIGIVANTITGGISGDSYYYKNKITVTNSGADTVTISEIGTIINFYIATGSICYILADRTVLDTPLTLAPGEQGVITYNFNLPIA